MSVSETITAGSVLSFSALIEKLNTIVLGFSLPFFVRCERVRELSSFLFLSTCAFTFRLFLFTLVRAKYGLADGRVMFQY